MFEGKYRITSGKFGPHMCLSSGWSDRIEKIFKRKRVLELELNYAKGWPRGSDLTFLKNIKELKSFELLDYQVSDISAINELNDLRLLKVNSNCNNVINCSNFPNLESISLEWFPNVKSLFGCVSLKSVFINCCKIKDLSVFKNLQNLEVLRLKSPGIERIGDISSLENLRFLELGNARKLMSLDGIQAVPALEVLELNRCRKIKDIEPVKHLPLLKRLFLINSGKIESLKPVSDLKNLEKILFYESTNIMDGDLSPLKELPCLKEISFVDRKHYNLTMEDFEPGYNKRLKKVLKKFGGA